MTEFESVMQTAAQAAREAEAAAQAQAQAQATRDQIRDQIRENVRAAVAGAEDAASQGGRSGVSVTEGPGGNPVITVPDGRGGTQRIVVNDNGVTVNGQPMTGMDFRNAVPTGVVDIVQTVGATLVLCVVGFPLARAFGRWLDRRGTAPKIPAEVMTRLSSIENAVETVAVEVERISEGQRFTAKLLNERAARDLQAPVGAGDRMSR